MLPLGCALRCEHMRFASTVTLALFGHRALFGMMLQPELFQRSL